MEYKIETAISELQDSWKNLNIESIHKIKSVMGTLARDPEIQKHLQAETKNHPKGLELFRDPKAGFVLLAYSETQGTYRIPHDHGDAWVIYVVASGEVEMGNYFKSTQPNGQSALIQKIRETLTSGDTRIYYPSEIHDTRCVSESAVILRLTSLDLKEEERGGRMKRYQI